jgi:hypothetical protein
MASYNSYRRIATDRIPDASITQDKLELGAVNKTGVLWVYNSRGFSCHACANAGGCCEQANGRCCLWTVPDGVTKVTFEIWSGGGGGAGHTCCNCCSFAIGGAGGNYATKTITTTPGCTYTVCAGGAWPCNKSHTCGAGMGCRSYVTGYNLSNFCAVGGCGGWMCNGDAWGPRTQQSCANCNICGIFGADYGMMGTTGVKLGHLGCHCSGADGQFTGQPPIIGKWNMSMATEAWCSCGCYNNWPAGGGVSGASSYCNNFAKQCAGGSGQGGSGIVKVTYA